MSARYKSITIQRPFQPTGHPSRDAKQVHVILDDGRVIRRLLITIPGPRHPRRGDVSEDAWQKAMGLLTLIELAKWHPDDLPHEDGQEIIIGLETGEFGVSIETLAEHRLAQYEIVSTEYTWTARAKPDRNKQGSKG